ncbi:MAG: AMP-binding protein [Bacteroidota bacterium]
MKLVHPQFKLNGIPLDEDTLREVAYSWVKEGEDFEIQAGDFLLDWLSASGTLFVKTSGSTGKPKTIPLKKKAMVNSALATGQYFDLKPEDAALLCLSTGHIAGKMMLVRAMVLGLQLDVVAPSSYPMAGIKREYDFVAMVPLQVKNSLAAMNRIKTLIVGGAPIATSLRKQLAGQSNNIYETYGMTETITHVAVKKVSEPKGKAVEGCFETLPGVSILKDERGCLVIKASNIADKPIVTNDLVDIIDKNHFKWLGRYDNVINSGGVKLIPEQIEKKLSAIITNRFFVYGQPDEDLGEQLIVVVEGKINTEELWDAVRLLGTLDKFEIPRKIYTLDAFLETSTTKIDRRNTMAKVLG